MRAACAVVLLGCGRIGFGVLGDDGGGPTVDARATATPPLQITDVNASPSLGSDCVSLAWSGTQWAIAWPDTRDGNSEIYVALSDGTSNLGPNVRVTNDPAVSSCPV